MDSVENILLKNFNTLQSQLQSLLAPQQKLNPLLLSMINFQSPLPFQAPVSPTSTGSNIIDRVAMDFVHNQAKKPRYSDRLLTEISRNPWQTNAGSMQGIPVTYSLKPEPVFTICPPASDRLKGRVYIVRGTLKKWDGKRFARCCRNAFCTKLAQGPTNYCKAHGGGTRCKVSGCKKAARGGSECCAVHGGGKKCLEDNCTKPAEIEDPHCRRHSRMPGYSFMQPLTNALVGTIKTDKPVILQNECNDRAVPSAA
mmetsp:Transcript_25834/g.31731  ORF Transcript_25834/g.31731 Transcript_25834/m.31731 type:complete len:255 (-) Transcript_25834:320-1084(-)